MLRYGLWGRAVLDGMRNENLLLDVLILVLGIVIYTLASLKKEYHPARKVCIAFAVYTVFLGLQLSIICLIAPAAVWAVLEVLSLFGNPPVKAASSQEERIQKRKDALQRVIRLGYRIDDCLTEDSKRECESDAQALFNAPEDADTSDIELFLSCWGDYELRPEEGSRRNP